MTLVRKQSFPPLVDKKSRVLILGSLPGEESLRLQQYYAHPRNQFWSIIYHLFAETPVDNYMERCRFLLEHGIALWDVVASAERMGSLDKNIKNVVANDIAGLLCEYPAIKAICLNGGTAARLFKRYNKLVLEKIPFHLLSSSSPIPGRNVKLLTDKQREWSLIIDLLM